MPFPLLALLPAALGAAGQMGASAIGGAMAGSDRDRARRLLERAYAEYGNIDLPTLEKLAAEELGPSAMERVQEQMDPRLRDQQMRVIEQLGSLAQDGDTAETRAATNQILRDVGRQESAGRTAILDNMRARGVSGSGAELAAQLSNQQASAERAQQGGLDQAAQAKRRMYEAMMSQGQMASGVRNQDYGMASDAARAKDMISQYNANARTRVNEYNARLPQQQFDNRMQLTQGKANAAAGQASNLERSADRTGAIAGGIGQGIGQAGATFADWLKDDKKEGK